MAATRSSRRLRPATLAQQKEAEKPSIMDVFRDDSPTKPTQRMLITEIVVCSNDRYGILLWLADKFDST